MKKVSRLIRPTSSSATSNTSSTPPIKQDPYQSTLLKFGISLDLNSKKQNIDFPTRIEISPRIHTPIQLDTKIINVTPLKHTSRFTSIRGEKYNANWWFNDLDQQVDDLFMEDAKKISYQNLHKRTISHEKIPIKLYLDCIRDTPNGLLYLTQNQQWDIYKAIQNAPELTKTDIDRFLSAMTSTFKFSQKIPKVIESRSLEIFTDLKHLGFVPDSKTWSLMFRAFKGNLNFLTNIRNHVIKERSIQEKQSKKFTDLISEESVRTLLAAINTHKSPSIENLLHMIWLDIKSVKLELSLRLGVGFILLFRNTGGPDALNNVMNVHKILKQRVIKQPWNRHVYDALIDAYSELGENYKALMNVHVNAGYLPGKIFEWSDEIEELKIPRDDKIHEFVLNACIEDRNRSFIRQKSHSIFQTYIDSCKAEALLTTQAQDPSKFPKLFPYSTPYTYFRLIHAYSCLGDLNAAIRALNQWKHVRVWVLEIQKTRHEIYSREYTIDKDHVDSFPPPSIKALASLARCFATCSDFTGARNFFKREVFDDAVISNLWSKKIKERDISIKENIKDLERELENCKANKRTHLKDQIESLKGHLKQQIKINDCVGVKGPLEYVYSSFSKGWNQRLDSFYKVEGEVDEEWASATGAKIVEPELLSGGIDTSAMEMEMFFKEMIVLERKAIGMFLERIEEGGQLDQFEDGQEV